MLATSVAGSRNLRSNTLPSTTTGRPTHKRFAEPENARSGTMTLVNVSPVSTMRTIDGWESSAAVVVSTSAMVPVMRKRIMRRSVGIRATMSMGDDYRTWGHDTSERSAAERVVPRRIEGWRTYRRAMLGRIAPSYDTAVAVGHDPAKVSPFLRFTTTE